MINCALDNDETGVYWYSRYDSFDKKVKAEIIVCPGGAYFLVGAFLERVDYSCG